MSTTKAESTTRFASPRPFDRSRFLFATAAAAIVNIIIFTIASATGASLTVTVPQAMQITGAPVIAASILPAVLAGVVTWLVARRRPVFSTIARWMGLIVALVSVSSSLVAAADSGTAVSLSLMHVVSGLGWFIGVAAAEGRR